MKNKTTTYGLMLLVLFLWGYIVYKIYKGVTGDDAPLPVNTEKKTTVKESVAVDVDEYTLSLAYRDPFLGKAADSHVDRPRAALPRSGVRVSVATPRVQAPAATTEPIDWSFIQFKGIMKNPSSQKMVSIVMINNAQYMLEEGALAGGIKMLKVYKDSLKISYKNVKKTITR